MAYKPKAGETMSEPNVVPMTDVMLVLLIIMMVITPLLQNKMSLALAETNNPVKMPDASKDNAVIVSVTRDGSIYLKAKRVDPSQLTSDIVDQMKGRLQKVVYIEGDERAKYGAILQVYSDIQAAGVEQVGLITQKSAQHLTGPPSLGG
jgi:biopolymer transport protein TolR